MRKKFTVAQAELTSMKDSLVAAKPVTQRNAFLDCVCRVCKNAADDQLTKFQTNLIQMKAT